MSQMEYNLRKRNVSDISGVHDGKVTTSLDGTPSKVYLDLSERGQHSDTEASIGDGATDDNLNTGEEGNTDPEPKSTKKDFSSQVEIKDIPVIKMDDFSQVGTDEKLNLIMVAINKINTTFHHKFEEFNEQVNYEGGMKSQLNQCKQAIINIQESLDDEQDGAFPRLRDTESQIADLQETVAHLEEKIASMQNDIVILRGAVQVQEKQTASNTNKLVDLTARNMSHNIVISGLTGDNKEEDCKQKGL